MHLLWMIVAAFLICWATQIRAAKFGPLQEFGARMWLVLDIFVLILVVIGLEIAVHLGA